MFLGIDGGGSRTTAALFDRDGTFLCEAAAGSINFYSNPLSDVRDNLALLVRDVRRVAGISSFQSVFIGLSALNGPADDAQIRRLTDGVLQADVIGMDSDLFIALEAMSREGACAAAICGTGSMAVARDADDRILHKGGYGYLLGDEGSGYAIALDAVRCALRSADGSGEKTALADAVRAFFRAQNADELIDRFYDPPIRRQDVAAFLPEVRRCADSGDACAIRILETQADDFARTVRALLQTLPDDCPLGLWGGVFRHVPRFTARFRQSFPNRDVSFLPYPPQLGAVFAAWKQAGVQPTADVFARVRQTYRIGACDDVDL